MKSYIPLSSCIYLASSMINISYNSMLSRGVNGNLHMSVQVKTFPKKYICNYKGRFNKLPLPVTSYIYVERVHSSNANQLALQYCAWLCIKLQGHINVYAPHLVVSRTVCPIHTHTHTNTATIAQSLVLALPSEGTLQSYL